jgi:4-cresol dehydrogenase (hydroxylating) flavoprotein subunit
MKDVIALFVAAIGRKNVLTEQREIEKYRHACIPVEREIEMALTPESVKQIQEIVKIADKYQTPLYPISTGKNWGYGSANPVRNNNIIVDLSGMNRILEVDKDLAFAVIEPGVTQQQLYDYLAKNQTGLIMDPTGSGPNCSVLGNTLERGYGISPYGNHFQSLCGMEIVLANGEILRTGFGRFQGAKANYTFQYGVGPYLDGLFTQSNFGIVTKIGVWLMPEPEYFEACYFFSDSEASLGPLIDSVRWLMLHNVVKGSINLVHRNRSLTMLSQYPWKTMKGRTPLDEALWESMAAERNIGTWNGVAGLYGTKPEVAAAKKIIKQQLRGKVKKLVFLNDRTLHVADKLKVVLSPILKMNLPELLKVLKPSYNLLKGKPCEVSLPSPYWRKKSPPPHRNINPAHDNCGIIWFAPVVPMKTEYAKEFIDIVTPLFRRFGFEACITFTAVNPRSFDCTLPILYDKENHEETERAIACHEQVLKECTAKGYVPYRMGIQSMEQMVGEKNVFWNVVEKLKDTLDPQGIFSPGRYCR